MKKKGIILLASIGALISLGFVSCGLSTFWIHSDEVKEETVALASVSDLNIDLTSADLTVRLGEENSLHYVLPERMVPEITQNGGLLSVRQPDHINIGFNLSLSQNMNHIEITLDEKTLDKLEISLTSGDISVDGFDFAGSISSTSGDITVCNTENGGNLSLAATSGDVTMTNCCFEKITHDQTSGETVMNQVTAESLTMESTSGDTKLSGLSVGNAVIDCTSGEIDLELFGSEQDYNYDCSCICGSVNVAGTKSERKYEKDNGAQKTMHLDTTSGDITVRFISEDART